MSLLPLEEAGSGGPHAEAAGANGAAAADVAEAVLSAPALSRPGAPAAARAPAPAPVPPASNPAHGALLVAAVAPPAAAPTPLAQLDRLSATVPSQIGRAHV